jgi:hypothetical protein
MKKIIIILAFAYLTLLFPSSTLAQDKCEAPTLNRGDIWRYRDQRGKEWNRKVLSIEGDMYVISDKTFYGRQKLGYDKNTFNLNFIIEADGRRTTFTGARGKVLDFPLFIGKKWSHLISVIPRKGKVATSEVNFKEDHLVSAYEDVKVAAGTFKAFKIEYQNMDMARSLQTARGAYWYSPEVKTIVKRTEELGLAKGDWELISYQLRQ